MPGLYLNTIVYKTNIWQPKPSGLGPTVFYAFVIGAIVLIMAVLALIVRRKKGARISNGFFVNTAQDA